MYAARRSLSILALALSASTALAGCGGGNGGSNSNNGGGVALTNCTPAVTCSDDGSKSYQACSGVTGTDCGYIASDGSQYRCGANCDCMSAAQQTIAWCHGSAATGPGSGTPSSGTPSSGTPSPSGTPGTGGPVVVGSCDSFFSCGGSGITRQICHLSDGTCTVLIGPGNNRFMPAFDCRRSDKVIQGVCEGKMAPPVISYCLELSACVSAGCTDADDVAGQCTANCLQAAPLDSDVRKAYAANANCIHDECTRQGVCVDGSGASQDAPGQPAGACLTCRKAASMPADQCVGNPSCGVCHDKTLACTLN